MGVPNMCLDLKSVDGKVVSIAETQTHTDREIIIQIVNNFHIHSCLFIGICDDDQFHCESGICKYTDNSNCSGPCIRKDWVGDGMADCTDGSDECKQFIGFYFTLDRGGGTPLLD